MTATQPHVHICDPALDQATSLRTLLARRRVAVTTGPVAEAPMGATLVAAAVAGVERQVVDAARARSARTIIFVRTDATAPATQPSMAGRVLHVDLPRTTGGDPAMDPVRLWLADIVAKPLRPMVAADPETGELIDLAERVARTDVTVFINGPTGSGKEVLARQIHDASRRAAGPFVALNCAAIPENMLEAMLFGHEKGAFTGAAVAGPGLVRAANGGTLLLDEISEMPLGLQAKLLRVIQERRVTPLGSTTEVPVDIRIVATSNRNMLSEVRAGRFREDLYYRLNVFPLSTRPLSGRRADVPALAVALLSRHAPDGVPPEFSPAAISMLVAHDWPGNVRELENVVQRALVLCDGKRIEPDAIAIDGVGGLMIPSRPKLAVAV